MHFIRLTFHSPTNLAEATTMKYLHSKELPSPMGMYLTAFANDAKIEEAQTIYGGEMISWEEMKNLVAKDCK